MDGQIENLEDLLKEKDNQVDMARARMTAMQAHHCSSEGALSSLEEAIGDKDKQITQLRDQRDRAEQEKHEERELHERELAEYKMKLHALDNEVLDSFLFLMHFCFISILVDFESSTSICLWALFRSFFLLLSSNLSHVIRSMEDLNLT